MERKVLQHPIAPVWDQEAKVLILGSFPSVRSRAEGFYYSHPQNRFWRVLASLYGGTVPAGIEEKKAFLHAHHIALWDVVASCTIVGSSDESIAAVTVNDIGPLLAGSRIDAIFCNGRQAAHLYEKHLFPLTGRAAVTLPSTSPANARFSLSDLLSAWSVLCSR